MLVKDYNLLQWMNVNSFRTSHYPYSEEWYQHADYWGLAIIDESPAVGMKDPSWTNNNETILHHKNVMREMVIRDRNHPSVVMFSLANEPQSDSAKSKWYISDLVAYTRTLEPISPRPLTFVTMMDYNNDIWMPLFDVICVNRYYGWYSDTGMLPVITRQMELNLANWHQTYPTKPIIVSEFGADTIAGGHSDPALIFTEDFQSAFLA
jgi:beta-glucuronidase